MLALLFPGQGSHTLGDRADVQRHAPDVLEVLFEAVGEDPFPLVGESTAYAQPAIFAASLARLRASGLQARDAAYVAGHSLGELTALTAAGALTLEDGLRLVVERGRLMAEAPAGAMVVVKSGVDDATRLAEGHGLVVANDNAPGQVVLSGAADRADQAVAAAKGTGLRATRLGVTGAFHSPLMAEARVAFAAALAAVPFAEPEVPVLCCATAQPFTDPQTQLAAALTEPVRWREIVLALQGRGVTTFTEVGPGTVLDGLVRRIAPDATRAPIELPSEPAVDDREPTPGETPDAARVAAHVGA